MYTFLRMSGFRGSVGNGWRNPVELHIFAAWTENILRVGEMEYVDNYNGEQAYKVTVQEPESERVFSRPHPDLTGYVGVKKFAFYYETLMSIST